MKKRITILSIIALISLFLVNPTLQAQDYKHSIGASVGSINGVSYKLFITDYVAFQADIGVGMDLIYLLDKRLPMSIMINPSFVWQDYIGVSDVSWFIGGGLIGGYYFAENYRGSSDFFDIWDDSPLGSNFDKAGKISLTSIEGIEWTLASVPLTFQVDLRTGIGVRFSKSMRTMLHYELLLSLGIRYTIK